MLKKEWVRVMRERREGDGAGGKQVVLYTLRQRYRCTINRRRSSRSDLRLEGAAHGILGAGVENEIHRIVCFRPPFPSLQQDDRLVAGDGNAYLVLAIRHYGWALQVEVRLCKEKPA